MKRQIKLYINIGNDAVQTPEQVGSLLQEVGMRMSVMAPARIEQEGVEQELFSILDTNGNTVGAVSYVTDPVPLERLFKKKG